MVSRTSHPDSSDMARRRSTDEPADLLIRLLGLGLILAVLGLTAAAQSTMVLALALLAVGGVGLVLLVRHRRVARRRFETTLDGFLALSPTEFEVEVGRVLEAAGHGRMQRVGGAGDLSIDVRGRDTTGRTALVQCKRYARTKRIGSPAIQQFYGMCHYHDPSALPIFVTTADYTADARTVARKAGVRLIDGNDLVALALQARALQRPSGALIDAQAVAPRGELGH